MIHRSVVALGSSSRLCGGVREVWPFANLRYNGANEIAAGGGAMQATSSRRRVLKHARRVTGHFRLRGDCTAPPVLWIAFP